MNLQQDTLKLYFSKYDQRIHTDISPENNTVSSELNISEYLGLGIPTITEYLISNGKLKTEIPFINNPDLYELDTTSLNKYLFQELNTSPLTAYFACSPLIKNLNYGTNIGLISTLLHPSVISFIAPFCIAGLLGTIYNTKYDHNISHIFPKKMIRKINQRIMDSINSQDSTDTIDVGTKLNELNEIIGNRKNIAEMVYDAVKHASPPIYLKGNITEVTQIFPEDNISGTINRDQSISLNITQAKYEITIKSEDNTSYLDISSDIHISKHPTQENYSIEISNTTLKKIT